MRTLFFITKISRNNFQLTRFTRPMFKTDNSSFNGPWARFLYFSPGRAALNIPHRKITLDMNSCSCYVLLFITELREQNWKQSDWQFIYSLQGSSEVNKTSWNRRISKKQTQLRFSLNLHILLLCLLLFFWLPSLSSKLVFANSCALKTTLFTRPQTA